jgi:hypothetical protein
MLAGQCVTALGPPRRLEALSPEFPDAIDGGDQEPPRRLG